MTNKEKQEMAVAAYLADRSNVRLRNEVVEAHMEIVHHIVRKRFSIKPSDISDAVNEGVFGLMTALDKFDPNHGAKFSSYAPYWVSNQIRMFGKKLLGFRCNMLDFDVTKELRKFRQGEESCFQQSAEVDNETVACQQEGAEARVIGQSSRDRVREAVLELMEQEQDERFISIVRERILADEPASLRSLAKKFGVSHQAVEQKENKFYAKLESILRPLD